jgi:hypothetical protein
LPEDRVVWYSNTTSAMSLADIDTDESARMSLLGQFCGDSSWFKVDTSALAVETVCDDSSAPGDSFEVSLFGQSTHFKSLDYQPYSSSEFVFDFSVSEIDLGVTPTCSLKSIPFLYFPGRLVSDSFDRFRQRAREVRRRTIIENEERIIREKEQFELKRKQMIEIKQKQNDLLQLALKRAQNKKPLTVSAPPTPPMNVWSSAAARPSPAPIMMPEPANPWSSRPMISPAVPAAWTMPVPPSAFRPLPVADPWSTAAAQAWTPPPADPPPAKKPKTEENVDEVQRKRMARFGIPFK